MLLVSGGQSAGSLRAHEPSSGLQRRFLSSKVAPSGVNDAMLPHFDQAIPLVGVSGITWCLRVNRLAATASSHLINSLIEFLCGRPRGEGKLSPITKKVIHIHIFVHHEGHIPELSGVPMRY